MIVETSALVAIILGEPKELELTEKIMEAERLQIASPSLLEAYMVLTRHLGGRARSVLSETIEELGINIVPFTPEHAEEAMRAFDRYGKGRHPARLNFGDCVAYALAKSSDQPLLFVGDDFTKTDVQAA